MSFRCPLCLEKLGVESQLLRFCVSHPAPPESFSPYQHLNKILCPGDRGNSHGPVEAGVFLAHAGCVCTNPFWNDKQVAVPETVYRANARVDHWIIGVLREIAGYCSNVREMWFPQILFRAANLSDGEKPVGALVMMVGARQSGKTVLSTMAMVPSSYMPELEVEHFVHITHGTGAQQSSELFHILQILDNMRQFRGTADPPTATDKGNISNIKSVYFRVDETGIRDLKSKFSAKGYLKDVVKVLAGIDSSMHTSQRVVAFYDMAGERFTSFDREILSFRSKVDVIAIFLDASAISTFKIMNDLSSKDAAWVAYEQLQKTSNFTGRRCIMVTKIDKLPNGDTPQPAGDGAQRDLLLAWLANGTDVEKSLHSAIMKDPAVRVFFVGTKGIGKPDEPAQTIGLLSFVRWCLDWQTAQR
ncbi:MAG TPA: hypothetical protein VKY85_20595 [Candidatus Angelobacter sp.]|nr:hypothetical protein [Candidatus Angelobacter sp.]